MNTKEYIPVNGSGEYPQMSSEQMRDCSGLAPSPQYLEHLTALLRSNGSLAGGLSGMMPNISAD